MQSWWSTCQDFPAFSAFRGSEGQNLGLGDLALVCLFPLASCSPWPPAPLSTPPAAPTPCSPHHAGSEALVCPSWSGTLSCRPLSLAWPLLSDSAGASSESSPIWVVILFSSWGKGLLVCVPRQHQRAPGPIYCLPEPSPAPSLTQPRHPGCPGQGDLKSMLICRSLGSSLGPISCEEGTQLVWASLDHVGIAGPCGPPRQRLQLALLGSRKRPETCISQVTVEAMPPTLTCPHLPALQAFPA